MIGAELEWPETKGAGIKVAVLVLADTKHPDLKHIAGTIDFTGEGIEDKKRTRDLVLWRHCCQGQNERCGPGVRALCREGNE